MGIRQLDISFFIPEDLSIHKQVAFNKLGQHFGCIARTVKELEDLPLSIIPMVGCTIKIGPIIREWVRTNRQFIYWDRGYFLRQGFTSLPRPKDDGYFRVHLNTFQMQKIEGVKDDRFKRCGIRISKWRCGGRKIVVAEPSPTYARFHALNNWTEQTIYTLRQHTDRPIRVRSKLNTTSSLQSDLNDAHALVTHGSIAAVESVIHGVPVFVDQSSAAVLVGKTNLAEIEYPIRPDRTEWLNALAYTQFTRKEITSGYAFEGLGT